MKRRAYAYKPWRIFFAEEFGLLFMAEASKSIEMQIEFIRTDLRSYKIWSEGRFSALAEEMRRVQARDEWLAAQVTETRRMLRRQDELLEEIVAFLKGRDGGDDDLECNNLECGDLICGEGENECEEPS